MNSRTSQQPNLTKQDSHTTTKCLWRIVLIEDNPADQFIVEQFFDEIGNVDVSTYDDADTAFDHIHDIRKADCILLDNSLPGYDGLECLDEFNKAGNMPPIIMLSGTKDDKVVIETLKNGAKDFLSKDRLTREALERSITNAVSKHQLATELESRNEEARQFASVLSHDLKSPMRVMTLLSEEISSEFAKENFNQERTGLLFEELKTNMFYMRGLIHGLIGYVQSGRQQENFTEVDLSELVKTVIKAISHDEASRKPHIKVAPLPIVNGDQTGLTQVFQNLIDNALKFNESPERQVTISCDEKDYQYSICIQDNGIGIAPEHFEKIFQPLQRLHNQSHSEGTGLGLALVKKIIEQHKWDISVDSEVTIGSSFCINIPKP